MSNQVVPQTVFGGRYRLVSKLGEGGMATVWRAEHLTLHSSVAVKLMHDSLAQDPGARARFVREARAAAALRSPHVVQILDYGVESACDCPYIVMELLEGETLAQRLRRERPLTNDDTTWILDHVSVALERAHEAGIVHRDLKPANIFLVDGASRLAKVLDFGIAKNLGGGTAAGTNPQTMDGTMLGTPHYMSPEQVESHVAIDQSVDIWAFGVIAFECVTGQLPFQGASLPSLIRAICDRPLPLPSDASPVPVGFDAWFARAANRDPKKRFPSAREAMEELAAVIRAPVARPTHLRRAVEMAPSTLLDAAPRSIAATSLTLASWVKRLRGTTSARLTAGIVAALLLLAVLVVYFASSIRRVDRLPANMHGTSTSIAESATVAPTVNIPPPSAAATTRIEVTRSSAIAPATAATRAQLLQSRRRIPRTESSIRQPMTAASVSAEIQGHADEDLGL